MSKIIFIADLLSQPRCIKRVSSIHNAGYDCEVFGYNRGQYDCNSYPSVIKVHVLPQVIENGKGYLIKAKIFYKNIRAISKQFPDEKVLFYAFGFLHAMFLFLLRRRYVYEISDVFYGYPKYNLIRPLLKLLDKILIKRAQLTVMTSHGFFNYYGLHHDNIIVQPNKPDVYFEGVERRRKNISTKIRFGFIGAIRYETVFRFSEVIGKYFPRHEFYFFGGASAEVERRCMDLSKTYSNIFYKGQYKNPDDLSSIYSSVDVVVSCYDTVSLNERIAEPNKLYEAILYCCPIIVSANTFLAAQVNKMECGFVIDASSEAAIQSFVANIDSSVLEHISQKELNVPKSEILDNKKLLLSKLYDIFQKDITKK